MFNKRNSFMVYNRIKLILNSIESNIQSKKDKKINKLKIIFVSKGYNIKDINDIDYDIYYDNICDDEFDMIIKHFRKLDYKYKQARFNSYNYLKIKLIKEKDCILL